MTQIVPTQAVPSQTLNVVLGNQNCTINIYAKTLYTLGQPEYLTNGGGNWITDSYGRPLIGIEAQYLLTSAVFLDLYVAGTLIIGGVICKNARSIVRNTYLGFIGDIAFYDMQAQTDPAYTGLGTQYQLVYFPSAA